MQAAFGEKGSPPQVRGKLRRKKRRIATSRITPAGAGKTMILIIQKSTNAGSPPQVRGKPLLSLSTTYSPRITPAGAGKTPSMSRGCAGTNGSPPQVRGKPCHAGSVPAATRITPAGAGKTYLNIPPEFFAQDHPRRCGENCGIYPTRYLFGGSPPQVRGKPLYTPCRASPRGITPAGAGKTPGFICPRLLTRDHPRRCGENSYMQRHHFTLKGSPPQVRGKQTKTHLHEV